MLSKVASGKVPEVAVRHSIGLPGHRSLGDCTKFPQCWSPDDRGRPMMLGGRRSYRGGSATAFRLVTGLSGVVGKNRIGWLAERAIRGDRQRVCKVFCPCL